MTQFVPSQMHAQLHAHAKSGRCGWRLRNARLALKSRVSRDVRHRLSSCSDSDVRRPETGHKRIEKESAHQSAFTNLSQRCALQTAARLVGQGLPAKALLGELRASYIQRAAC